MSWKLHIKEFIKENTNTANMPSFPNRTIRELGEYLRKNPEEKLTG